MYVGRRAMGLGQWVYVGVWQWVYVGVGQWV